MLLSTPRVQTSEQDDTTRIVESATVRVGLALPTAVLERIQAAVVGMQEERPSRTELIGAFILHAPGDGEELAALVRAFRRTRTEFGH